MNIIGASGHAKVIIDILSENDQSISGVWDDNQNLHTFQGFKVNGNVNAFSENSSGSSIIAIGNNKIRKQISEQVNSVYGTAIHPRSFLSNSVCVGQGTVVMPNASINIDSTIGEHVIINTNASVDHDCTIEDFVHISPQVALAGNVIVGEGTHIGIGASVIQGVKIGRWATIGAGAVVIRDVPDYAVVVGNPASIIKYNSNTTKKMNDKIWLSSPHMGGTEQKYVNEAFETNWIAPLGPHVNNFELDLASYTKTEHAAALSSGTAALHLALVMLGVGPGDEVICQSMTFSASANPIAYLGATPVFVDSERETWNMCPVLLNKAIKDRIAKGKTPKAIIPVHLYGMPAQMDKIMAVAKNYNIPVVEDAAEALGSRIKNKAMGSYGEMGVLSFNGNKIITTSGGGALLSNDKERIEKARFLATQARDAAPHYQHSEIGYNYRMSNISAGIGRGQMEVLDKHIEKRRENFNTYINEFAEIKGITLLEEPKGYYSNRWLSALVIDPEFSNGVTKEDLMEALLVDNIESRPLWKPMHLQPVFEGSPSYVNGTSEYLFEHGLCLPSGSNLTKEDLDRVCSIIKSTFAKAEEVVTQNAELL